MLEDYWKKKWKKCTDDDTVKFKFSGKKVRGKLSFQSGDGWEAALTKAEMVRGLD